MDLESGDQEGEVTQKLSRRWGENPPKNHSICPYCGLAFTPDAKKAMDDAEDATVKSYREVDPDDGDTVEKVQLIDDLLDDPEVRDALAKRREES